ncbi:hypothetical protein, partial [Micropruina sp.]|uniref:hypothetical protein n=1 Tax=Micropruina sp. TaxID=2737536 RepID=UPI0026071D08
FAGGVSTSSTDEIQLFPETAEIQLFPETAEIQLFPEKALIIHVIRASTRDLRWGGIPDQARDDDGEALTSESLS